MIRIILQKIKRKWIVKHDHPDERRLRAWYKKYRDIEVGKYTYGYGELILLQKQR